MENKFSVKKKVVIASIAFATLIALILCIVLPCELVKRKGKPTTEFWTNLNEYKIEDTFVLEKKEGEEFKILNLTDVQFSDTLDVGNTKIAYSTIDLMVAEQKPNLITITGDSVWTMSTRKSMVKFVKHMDSYGIPWAPVFGNHDREGNIDLNYIADMFEKAEHCLFKKGAIGLSGVGNYIINIVENGKIAQSLIMLDSHASTIDGYDFIKYDQIEWYKWAVAGATKYNNNGKIAESTLFFHIPLPEFKDAYEYWESTGFDKNIGFGKNNEDVCCSKHNTGFFEIIKNLGSTKNIVVGHDHVNNSSIMYQGVRLTYSTKTGDRCYWVKDGSMNGGTLLTLGDVLTTTHIYVKP
ncbi:MAG: metallophosphoesterase [Clostridia bacterium]